MPYPVCVLEGPDEEVDEPGNGSILPEGGMVGGAQRQVADEADDRLDERPAGRWVHEADNRGQTALQPHCILGHLTLGMPEDSLMSDSFLKKIAVKLTKKARNLTRTFCM